MEDHTVRVSHENLEALKNYKGKWSLSYNDIIGMSLKLLDGKVDKKYAEDLSKEQLLTICNALSEQLKKEDCKSHDTVQAPIYKIKVSLNRVRINDNVLNLLKNGYDLFIPDITHRQAMYVKRKLNNIGFDCEYNKGESGGKTGFLFSQPVEVKNNGRLYNLQAQPQPQPVLG
jgi:hypothetical protein